MSAVQYVCNQARWRWIAGDWAMIGCGHLWPQLAPVNQGWLPYFALLGLMSAGKNRCALKLSHETWCVLFLYDVDVCSYLFYLYNSRGRPLQMHYVNVTGTFSIIGLVFYKKINIYPHGNFYYSYIHKQHYYWWSLFLTLCWIKRQRQCYTTSGDREEGEAWARIGCQILSLGELEQATLFGTYRSAKDRTERAH